MVYPIHKLIHGERVFRPVTIGKAEGDIIRQLVILQQEVDPFGIIFVGKQGAAPLEDAVNSLREDGSKALNLIHQVADSILINQLCIAEGAGLNAKLILHQLAVESHLIQKFIGIIEGCQAVIVGLSQDFHTAGIHQFLERIQGLRAIQLKLLDCRAGDGKGYLEASLMLFDQIQQQSVCGQVTLFCHLAHHLTIELVVKEVAILAYVQNAHVTQADGLVHLKVKYYI